MKIRILLLKFAILGAEECICQHDKYLYKSETLKVKQISDHVFIHISYLETVDYGLVACNGMVIAKDGEAFVFDTPAGDEGSKELISWIRDELKSKINGVVATHFHVDCLGGLGEFHREGIPSFASSHTIELAKNMKYPLPKQGFEGSLELKIGDHLIINKFPGEGHTRDNIVSYYFEDQILFGGCLIKSLGAGKGNLEDASPNKWSITVRNVKENYPEAKIIIPGHGKEGNTALLDYTISLFLDD